MNTKGQAGAMIGIAIALIVGIVVASIITSQVQDHTDLDTYLNESQTSASDIVTLEHSPVTAINAIYNGTLKIANYSWKSTGWVNISQNGQRASDTYTIEYVAEPSGYLTGTAATVADLIPLVFALVLFASVAVYIVKGD